MPTLSLGILLDYTVRTRTPELTVQIARVHFQQLYQSFPGSVLPRANFPAIEYTPYPGLATHKGCGYTLAMWSGVWKVHTGAINRKRRDLAQSLSDLELQGTQEFSTQNLVSRLLWRYICQSIGLTKKFSWVFPYHLMGKFE